MSNLSNFLNQNVVKQENAKVVIGKRFLDQETGEPAEWEIAPITATREEEIRKACTRRVQVPGKKNQYTEQTDQSAYVRKLVTECVVSPNLNDAELQNSYGIMGADSLLMEMLLPGEYAELASKVNEITGFDISFEERVDDAKN